MRVSPASVPGAHPLKETRMNKTLIAVLTAASIFAFGAAQAADATAPASPAAEATAPAKAKPAKAKKVAKQKKGKTAKKADTTAK
jgi:hypothetical protein